MSGEIAFFGDPFYRFLGEILGDASGD